MHNGTPVTVTSSLNPAPRGKSVTYTAAVVTPDGGTATGTVIFQDNGTTIGTVKLTNNQAATSTQYSRGGSHAITATYSGDSRYTQSTSGTLTENVSSIATSTLVITSGSPSYVGQLVTFTATVTSTHGAIANGDLVAFYDGATLMATVPLASGVAAYTTSSLLAGKAHYIKATYVGDSTFMPSSSHTVLQVVDRYSTTTTLSASPNPSSYAELITWTATVTSTGPTTPTGTVRFKGANGAGTLSGGKATYVNRWLDAGTHAVIAEYGGDAFSAPSASAVFNQVVNPASTTTTLASSPNPSTAGQTVKFTAKVKSSTGASPVGTVTFTAGTMVLGTVEIGNSPTSISTNALSVGSTVVEATYNGGLDFVGSTGTMTQVVYP